jgi:ABC-type sulfate transport system substrate-binding protein
VRNQENYYRPRDASVTAQYAERYPKLAMTTVQDFGG